MIRRSLLGLLLAGSLLVFAGCGPKGRSLQVEYVEGVITLDGRPLDEVSVMFIPKNEADGIEVASGYSNANGVYKLSSMNGDPERGAMAGDYIVTVSKVEVHDPKAGMSYEEASASTLDVIQKQLLPTVYQDRRNTPLSFTVNKGRNKIDIELKRKP